MKNISSVKNVIIIGFGGNSEDIIDIIESINEVNKIYNFVGFLDDDISKDTRIIGTLNDAKKFSKECYFIFSIGSERTYLFRKDILDKLELKDSNFITIIHPNSYISTTASIENGSIINANVCVGSNVKIGKFNIILSNTTIGHESNVGDYSIICSGVNLAGGVTIKESSYIGMGTNIKNFTIIGNKVLVGMGSNVLKNIGDSAIAYGNPAKIIR